MVFRTSPQLGPGVEQHATKFHWDGENVDVSYRLGNPEKGSDGHVYVMVQAHADLAAGAAIAVNETTWQTAVGTGYLVPAGITGGVKSGEYFHARRTAL